MTKSKLIKAFLKKFSWLIGLMAVSVIGSIASGNVKSLVHNILDYSSIIIPLFVLFVLIACLPLIKGFLGEKSVQKVLSKLDKDKYKVLNNIMLKTDGKTTQIDHVVVSNYGIFVIETKNYRGWIIGDEYSEYWTQVIFKRKEKLYNPIRQNYGHVMALKEHLKDFGDIPVHSIISFSTRANLKVNTKTEVIYIESLPFTIRKYSTVESVSETNKEEIISKLNQLNIKDRDERHKHVDGIHDKKTNIKNMINMNVCPRCGNTLVKRNGKYGEFTGCSGFPQCRYNIKGEFNG